MTKKFTLFALFTSILIALTACSSVPKDIPEDLTAQELIQHGQQNFEDGNYKAALVYYNTAVERYSDWPSIYVEARYEIGHLYMKQKKEDKAEAIFNEILEIYRNSQPGTIPAAYKKLAELELAKISSL